MLSIIVQKYGGTSVENKEKLSIVCDNIISYRKKGYDVIVVVSAQGDSTDNLLKTAKEYSSIEDKRSLDLLLSTGEIQTVALLSMMLNERGYKTIGLTGAQAGIISDSTYGSASIKNIFKENIIKYVNDGIIVVVTGFQAIDKFGNITTLGRGGSDLSAVAIACSLNADKCEIYSDIDGIFSADPRIISNAKLLENISYSEMLEAATAGAKVLHNRSVSVAKKYNTPIIVKNSQKNTRGSIVENIIKEDVIEDYSIKFITKKDDISKICIIGDMVMSNKEAIVKIFNIAHEENITIYMISFSELAINIIVDKDKSLEFMKKLHDEIIE